MNLRSARPVAALPGARTPASVLVLTLLAIASADAFAQVPSSTLAPTVVTGTRTPTRIDQTIADTTVLDREAIQRTEARGLAELLAQQPGIQFTSNGPLGKTSSVFVRGLESRHVLLLIDGVRYGSATLGIPVWENLPIEEIDRIEIVRGPLSSLYGSDAVGGVVQVFTRRGTQGLVPNARVAVGSEGYRKLAAGVRFGQGPLDGAVQLQRTRVKGISSTNPKAQFGNHDPDRDGFEQDAASVRFGAALGGDWRADLRMMRSEGEVQIDDGPGADARAELLSQVMAAEFSGSLLPNWRTLLRAAHSRDAYNTLSSASLFTDLGTTATSQEQLTWENTLKTPVGTVIALAEHLHQKVSRPVRPFEVSERSIRSVALGLNGGTGPHHWQASVRHDRNSQFGKQTNGSVGYGFDILPSLRASASYATSYVMPSFNQLWYPGFGNPNLEPEEGKHGEAGLKWTGANQSARLTYFSNRIRGYITSGSRPENIPRARVDGVTLGYEAKIANVSLAGSIDHVDPRNKSGTNYDKLLPRRAKNAVKLAADAEFGAFTAGATFAAFSERFDDAANRPALRVAGYGTVDLRADWRFRPDLTLGLRLNNLADKRYETVYGYNQPGREVFVSLRYEGR